MNNINNSISFGGSIRIQTWNNLKRFDTVYHTNSEENKKLADVFSSIVKPNERTNYWPMPIVREQANKVYKVLEDIIGRPLKNIRSQKVIHYREKDGLLADRNVKFLDGEVISVYFDA